MFKYVLLGIGIAILLVALLFVFCAIKTNEKDDRKWSEINYESRRLC